MKNIDSSFDSVFDASQCNDIKNNKSNVDSLSASFD